MRSAPAPVTPHKSANLFSMSLFPNPAEPEPNAGWQKNLRRFVEDFTDKSLS